MLNEGCPQPLWEQEWNEAIEMMAFSYLANINYLKALGKTSSTAPESERRKEAQRFTAQPKPRSSV